MQEDLPFSRLQLSAGTRLNGIYEIDRLVAAGGMGEVYTAHTIQTGDAVAIKVLLPEFAENDAALALFRREASALHNLHHEAIVRYYVFTIEPALRRPYLAMEFVEGQSLADLVRREPLTYEAVRTLLKRIASGLHAAHERGIIHRDVSSDNIMIPGGDVARAKIIDFGIARSTQLTDRTIIGGGFAGKYNYVSPEQLGLFGGDVRAKSDIYSLGLVAIEALTGQPIDMGGTQAQIIDKRRKVPDLGAIDLRIRPLLERMLQPDPAARPDSMAQVAAWPLPTSRPGEATDTPVTGRTARPARTGQRSAVTWVAAASLAIVLVAGGVAALVLLRSAPVPVEPPPPALTTGPGPAIPGNQSKSAAGDLAPSAPPLLPGRPSSSGATQPPLSKGTATPPEPLPGSPAGPTLTPSTQPAPPTSSGTQTATLTPSPSLSRPDQITRYIERYDGGECFFITPTSVGTGTVRIDGYGASAAPFQALDDAFRRNIGFEAAIDVRQVTAAQCPALTFAARLRNQDRAPQLQIGQTSLRSGEALTGSIEGAAASVQLLLVTDEGLVLDISHLLKSAGDTRSFDLRMQRTGTAGAQPQLLVALSSDRPFATLKGADSTPADRLFPLALAEATRSGQSVGATIRYFKLDR